MLPLAEASKFLDSMPTVIGNKYGDIYESQLIAAENSNLNKQ
jgi:hypothetical protein